MTRYPGPLLLFVLLSAPVLGGDAPSAGQIAALREEMAAVRADYEQRMLDLEARLARLEQGMDPSADAASSSRLSLAGGNVPGVSDAPKEPEVAQMNEWIFDYRITESRERAIRIADSEVLTDRAEAVLEDFVRFNGYFRAGYGRNDEGGTQVGFGAPGAFAKYRLGNEAETYGELSLTKDWFNPGVFSLRQADPPDWETAGPLATFKMTMAVFNPYGESFTGSATSVTLPETWVGLANVIPSQPTAVFWAGNRFYRRHDIHLNDFFFYNMSGGGGGIEDVDLGPGRLAFAWIGTGSQSGFSDLPEPDPVNKAGFSKANWDLRFYDFSVPFGKAEIGLTYARADAGFDVDGNTVKPSDGWAVNIIHTREGFLRPDGMNKLTIQYGTGAARTFNSGFETFVVEGDSYIRPEAEDSRRFRVTENFVVDFSDTFSLSPVLVYQYTDFGQDRGTQEWFSAGLRPVVYLTDYLNIAFEGGIDWVDDGETGLSGSLTKLTIAPQLSIGRGFNSRPVLRLYLTWASWSDDFVGHVGGLDYTNSSDGLTLGLQMETWW